MTRSTRDAAPPARPRSLRAVGTYTIMLLVCATSACGKKGPPLAPFVRVPAAVATIAPQRVGNDVYVSFTVPDANVDGQKPADIGAVDVYAVTADRPPATEEQREMATLIATLPVRPILPDLPIPANASAPPPLPLPPGVDRGAAVAILEPLTADARMPVELPVEDVAAVEAAGEEPQERIGPLVAPAPTQLPRRHYFVVAKSPRGRESLPSAVASVPLESGSSAPGAPVVTHTATDMTIAWPPSPDARTSTFPVPPTVKPLTGANATPATVRPPLPPLAAKSLGFNTEATTYHVYDATPVTIPPDPYATTLPKPITPAPVAGTQYVIKGVTFNAERCFEVRPIDNVFGSVVIGPASPRTLTASTLVRMEAPYPAAVRATAITSRASSKS